MNNVFSQRLREHIAAALDGRSVQDRSDLFCNTADRMELSDAIVEKGF